MKPTAAFRVEHDGKFIPGKAEIVKIIAIDDSGNPTPRYSSPGEVTLVDSPTGGSFNPETLTMGDFYYGVAEVEYTRNDSSATVISAIEGVIRGSSQSMVADSGTSIFNDVDTTHENAKAIEYLKDNNIINGYDDGTFKPDQTVNRAEALKMILLGFNITLTPTSELTFSDTDNEAWYAPYLGRALNLGVVKGYDDGTFKANQTVNRAEFLKILLEANKIPVRDIADIDPENLIYPDADSNQWYAGYAEYAGDKNIMPTDSSGNLNPSAGMTRADVAEAIYRMMVLDQTGASTYKNNLEI